MSKTPMPRAAPALAATLLVLTITHSSAADGGETNLYWSQRLGLDRATIDGKETRPIVRDAFAIYNSMVVDPRGVKLYWNDLDLNQVLRSNIDGSEIEFVAEVPGDVENVAIDEVGRGLFWITGTVIQRFDLVDGSVDDIIPMGILPGLGAPNLAVDPIGRKIYWADGQLLGSVIQRANLDGTDIEPLVQYTSNGFFNSIAVDPNAGRLYWLDDDDLFSANLDGSDQQFVTPDFSGPALAVDRQTGRLFANTGGAYIRSVDPPDPSEIDLAVVLSFGAFALVVDDDARRMYWTDGLGVYRAATTGAGRERIIAPEYADPFTSDDPFDWVIRGLDIDPPAEWLYFQADGAIQRADLNGANPEVLIPGADGERLRVDPVGGKLYWSEADTGRVLRANVDGTDVEEFLPSPGGDGASVQYVDGAGGWVYYSVEDLVFRAAVDGSPPVEFFEAPGVKNLIVDDDDRVYWSYSSIVLGSGVRRASLDGTNDENVGDLEFANALAFGASVVPGDVDGDGLTGFTDLVAILGTWGPCPCNDACISDLDLSGGVGMNDLTFLLGHWGATR